MKTKERDLINNEQKLKKSLIILFIFLVLLILGYFCGQALHHIVQ